MKHGHTKWLRLCGIVLALAFGMVGCGRSPDKAVKEPRQELAGLNLQFTPDDFVRSAGNGDLTAVKLFLDAGMGVDTRGSTSFTALAAAAMRGHLPVVKLLLERGANVNAAPDDGSTPLLHAAEKEHLPILEALVSKGANLNLTNSSGSTPLHWAVRRGNTNIVARLLKHGASTGIQETNGMTAVDCAAEPLLAAGFDPKTSTNAMVVLLRNHQASFATEWLLGQFTLSSSSNVYKLLTVEPVLTDKRFVTITNRLAECRVWMEKQGYGPKQVYWFQSAIARVVVKVWERTVWETSETPNAEHERKLNALLKEIRAGAPSQYRNLLPVLSDPLDGGLFPTEKRP